MTEPVSDERLSDDFIDHASQCTSQYDSTCRALASEVKRLRQRCPYDLACGHCACDERGTKNEEPYCLICKLEMQLAQREKVIAELPWPPYGTDTTALMDCNGCTPNGCIHDPNCPVLRFEKMLESF
jgi:hypothetical protein